MLTEKEDVFEKLCDEHGLMEECHCKKLILPMSCQICDDTCRTYPTLSELLDRVEKRYQPDEISFQYTPGEPPILFKAFKDNDDGDRKNLFRWFGDTKELAVLKALIAGDEDGG